jgi:glycosyltransferase involved in cell wall biosynthesis
LEKKKLRVLMLGWEFPPFLTGGLGKASYGIAKAISAYADLTLVVPQSDPSRFNESWRLIGLNEMYSIPADVSGILPAQISYIDADLDPYIVEHLIQQMPRFSLEALLEQFTNHLDALSPNLNRAQTQELYQTPDNYGSNLLTKIAAYTETVLELAETIPFDLVHAHDWMTFPAALQIKQRTEKPIVLHVHSLETDRMGATKVDPEENLAFRIEQKAFENADAVISVSQYTRDQIGEHYGLTPQLAQTVHNGPESVEAFRSTKGLKTKLVVWIGRVTVQKGTDYLLDTVEKLCRSDENVKFVVAGTGDQLSGLIEESARRRLSNKILFTGFLDEKQVRLLLSQADVFFMPSASEPFGLSALEAAQFNVPCVISKQSGVSEVLQSALMADHWDTNRLAGYLYALLHYEGLRKEVIDGCRRELETVSWDDSARKVMYVYENLPSHSSSVTLAKSI